jgi:antitoxin (DNA-binding transcriptional repressor) of toxin-antitoxin stability system
MERMTVADAEREFGNLVNRVYSEGISIELEQGDKVVARLTPGGPTVALESWQSKRILARPSSTGRRCGGL